MPICIAGVALLGYVLYESFKLDKEPRERMFAILFLISLNPLFWGLFEQAGGSMNLFTDRFVDRSGVPAGIFQSNLGDAAAQVHPGQQQATEHEEHQQRREGLVVPGEEVRGDVGGQETVDGEVEPLHEVADTHRDCTLANV